MLVKGDQLPLAILIKNNDTAVKPADIAKLRIKLNSKVYTYPNGEISFNSSTNKWELPVTQETILDFGDIMEISVQVDFGGTPRTIKTSPTQRLLVKDSLFKDIWG